METFLNFLNTPIGLMTLGWAIFNVALFVIKKDDYDESGSSFPIWPYFKGHIDNWLLNALVGLALVAVGQGKIDVSPLGIEWVDLYYLLPGPATEFLMVKLKKFLKDQKKKQAED